MCVGGLKTLYNPIFFRHSFLPHYSLPFTSLSHPASLWWDWKCWDIFWGNVGGQQSISYLMWVSFTRRRNNNNNASALPAQLDSISVHWLLKSYPITPRGDSTQGTGQGLWSPVKHTLPFLKNIPSGNSLAFPAKHELAWQSDQPIAPVHHILPVWLITITSPKSEWLQLQKERGKQERNSALEQTHVHTGSHPPKHRKSL